MTGVRVALRGGPLAFSVRVVVFPGICRAGRYSSSRGFIRRKIITPIRVTRATPIPTITQVLPRKSIIAFIEPALSESG